MAAAWLLMWGRMGCHLSLAVGVLATMIGRGGE
jgi:hypothetical protein